MWQFFACDLPSGNLVERQRQVEPFHTFGLQRQFAHVLVAMDRATNSRVSSFMIVIGDVPDFVVLIRRHSGDFLVSHDVDKSWIIVDECG